MRVLGRGAQLWRVEVVLWASNAARALENELLDLVAEATAVSGADDVPRVPDVAVAASYDIQPPAPDAGVGVACWVQAATVGDAANVAWDVISSRAERVLGER